MIELELSNYQEIKNRQQSLRLRKYLTPSVYNKRSLRVENEKELHREVIKISRPDRFQANLPRKVRQDVEASFAHHINTQFRDTQQLDEVSISRARALAKVASALAKVERVFESLFDNDPEIMRQFTSLNATECGVEMGVICDAVVQALKSHQELEAWQKPTLEFVARSSSVIAEWIELDVSGDTDGALDSVYQTVEKLLQKNRFDDLDKLLKAIEVPRCSTDILLGVLTATLPAKSHLPTREAFRSSVIEVVTARGENEQGLFDGL